MPDPNFIEQHWSSLAGQVNAATREGVRKARSESGIRDADCGIHGVPCALCAGETDWPSDSSHFQIIVCPRCVRKLCPHDLALIERIADAGYASSRACLASRAIELSTLRQGALDAIEVKDGLAREWDQAAREKSAAIELTQKLRRALKRCFWWNVAISAALAIVLRMLICK